MNKQGARAYLEDVRSLYQWIRYRDKRVKDLEEDIVSYGGTQIGDRVQTSPRGDTLEKRVIKYVETIERMQMQIIEKKQELIEKQDDAFRRIMELKEGRRRDFLIMYYIEGLSYSDISFALGHSELSRVYHLRDEALEYFAQMWEQNGWTQKNDLPT